MRIALLLISLIVLQEVVFCCLHGGVREPPGPKPSFIKKPLPFTKKSSLPVNFDWRNLNGRNYVTVTRNQHLPEYCGSCWAFGVTSSLSDRIRLMLNASYPEINLAPQVLLNCGLAGTCNGGSPLAAYEYIHREGIPDETCQPYEADDAIECIPFNVCRNCNFNLDNPKEDCFAQTNYTTYFVDEFGPLSGENDMMNEIYNRGPISCGVAVTSAFVNYTGGIFNDTTGDTTITHEISVAGWGVQQGVPYWIVRNSWGTFWGEDGWAQIIRGTNNLGIESACSWGTIKPFTINTGPITPST